MKKTKELTYDEKLIAKQMGKTEKEFLELKETIDLERNVETKEKAMQVLRTTKTIQSSRWYTIPKEVVEIATTEASVLYGTLLGFSNGIYRGSNQQLSEYMNITTRQLSRLLQELEYKRCIKIVVINKTTRLIYPLYTLPFILDIDNKKTTAKSNKINTQDKIVTPQEAKDFIEQLKEVRKK